MHRVLIIASSVLIASVAALAPITADADDHHPDEVYFEKTGQYVGGEFLRFWVEHGGVRIFGYPLTPVIEQDGIETQYFERHVMELHEDNRDGEYIFLRRLGAEARDDRGIADRWPFDPDEKGDSGRFFAATQQNMSGTFLRFWEENGGSRVFGYPISTTFRHYGTRVQFTERAILEHRPGNSSDWRVLSERLGTEAAERDEVDTSPQEHDGDAPVYSADLFDGNPHSFAPPSEIRIDRINVTADFEHVGRTPDGVMKAPAGWNNVAWFEPGTVPGEQGNSVVAGHYDAPGGVPAIFWNLDRLSRGDHVTIITEEDEELVFEVTGSQQFHINNQPSSRIFGRTDDHNLNLVTCAGSWDTSLGMYDERLVVYTTLVSD